MKAGSTIALVLLAAILALNLAKSDASRLGKQRRRQCEGICRQLSMYLDSTVYGEISNDAIKTNLASFFKRRALTNSVFYILFSRKVGAIQEHITRYRSTNKMCRKIKVCRSLITKKQWERKTRSSCGICKSSVTLIKASLALTNQTLQGLDQIAKQGCQMFLTDKKELDNCFKIVNGLATIETTLFDQLGSLKICQLIGFCVNSTLEDRLSCSEGMNDVSPWKAALAVVKESASAFFSGTKSIDDAVTNIKKQTLFTRINECVQHVAAGIGFKGSRGRRSVEEETCAPCQMMRRVGVSKLEDFENSPFRLTHKVQALCKSLSSGRDKRMCATIASLTNSSESLMSAVLPSEVCKQYTCAERSYSGKTCKICQQVNTVVAKELKYVSAIFDMITVQVESFCKQFGSTKVAGECKKVSKMVDKVAKVITKQLQDDKLCTELGLC